MVLRMPRRLASGGGGGLLMVVLLLLVVVFLLLSRSAAVFPQELAIRTYSNSLLLLQQPSLFAAFFRSFFLISDLGLVYPLLRHSLSVSSKSSW
ncbi:hypothetical protein BZA05DRAFT_59168 [Tricharina praecox]|uniref:uncharacterized protein n=1 Tax=Tricharina praecox TaxID=43433 RepID=UPI00221FB74B|nr:uncharacterized protein BZA05DRAFT_59168 [Tricharina praecox]KAI5850632.1 hypothetical protein BZA05DRAFT_59168 [Tricharina praecox]